MSRKVAIDLGVVIQVRRVSLCICVKWKRLHLSFVDRRNRERPTTSYRNGCYASLDFYMLTWTPPWSHAVISDLSFRMSFWSCGVFCRTV
jgi:hypothetical protein